MSSLRSCESDFYSIQSSIWQSSCQGLSLGFNHKDIRRLDKVYDSLSRSLLQKRCRKVELLQKIKYKIWKREEIKQSILFRRKVQQEDILRKKAQLENRLLIQLKEHNAAKESLQHLQSEINKDDNFDGNFWKAKKLLKLIQQNNQIKSSIQKIINLINLSSDNKIEQQQKLLQIERKSLISKYKVQGQDISTSINPYKASGHQLSTYSAIMSQQDKCKFTPLNFSEKWLQISTIELIKQKAQEEQERRNFFLKILKLKEDISILRREKRKLMQNQFGNSNNDQY